MFVIIYSLQLYIRLVYFRFHSVQKHIASMKVLLVSQNLYFAESFVYTKNLYFINSQLIALAIAAVEADPKAHNVGYGGYIPVSADTAQAPLTPASTTLITKPRILGYRGLYNPYYGSSYGYGGYNGLYSGYGGLYGRYVGYDPYGYYYGYTIPNYGYGLYGYGGLAHSLVDVSDDDDVTLESIDPRYNHHGYVYAPHGHNDDHSDDDDHQPGITSIDPRYHQLGYVYTPHGHNDDHSDDDDHQPGTSVIMSKGFHGLPIEGYNPYNPYGYGSGNDHHHHHHHQHSHGYDLSLIHI